MEFIVKRSEWFRGQGSAQSYLVRALDNKKCCLGFLGEACGVPIASMIGAGVPEVVLGKDRRLFPRSYFGSNDLVDRSIVSDEIIFTNDSKYLSEAERESKLIELFRKLDIDVRFED